MPTNKRKKKTEQNDKQGRFFSNKRRFSIKQNETGESIEKNILYFVQRRVARGERKKCQRHDYIDSQLKIYTQCIYNTHIFIYRQKN